MAKRTWLMGSLVACLIGAPHCSTGTAPSTPAAPPLPALTVDTSQVCLTIGPEGGSLTHAARARLVVPAGALETPTSLCLTGVAAPSEKALGAIALGQGFDASPSGQTFHKPVDLFIPFDAARMTPGAITSEVELRMAPQGTNDFVSLASSASLATGMVRSQTVHFTQFVPALNPNPVFITSPTALPQGTVGQAYAQSFAAAGGTAPYTWSIASASATPPGLAVVPTGSLSGTPTVPSNYGFFVVASDSASHSVQAAFALTVVAASNAVPTLAQVAPNTIPQGSPTTTVTLTGAAFAPTASALWDGAPIATTFVSATQLSAAIPTASLVSPGTHQIAVSNPAPGGGTSGALTFTITAVAQNPVPTIASAAPTDIPVATIDTQIAITGTNFIAATSAAIGAQGISTSYVSATQLLATIPAANLAAPGTLQIDVYNPPPGGGFSASSITVTIGSPNPVPTVASLSPSSAAAGSADFTLTATGTGFVNGGQLFFGSTALATTVSSATSASATVPANLVAQAGGVQVTFVNPTPGGGASGAIAFAFANVDAGTDAAIGTDASADAGGAGLTGCSFYGPCTAASAPLCYTGADPGLCDVPLAGICRFEIQKCDTTTGYYAAYSSYHASKPISAPGAEPDCTSLEPSCTLDSNQFLACTCTAALAGKICRAPARPGNCLNGLGFTQSSDEYFACSQVGSNWTLLGAVYIPCGP